MQKGTQHELYLHYGPLLGFPHSFASPFNYRHPFNASYSTMFQPRPPAEANAAVPDQAPLPQIHPAQPTPPLPDTDPSHNVSHPSHTTSPYPFDPAYGDQLSSAPTYDLWVPSNWENILQTPGAGPSTGAVPRSSYNQNTSPRALSYDFPPPGHEYDAPNDFTSN